ncbi:MAG: hypothetical protein RBT57_05490 [Paludibacter sp.]|jgi:hypothetical protein|nr:hypothetical protein [Paludibacter sp.]
MKQNPLKYQFTALLAALYFIVAGIGHNVVDYCCNSCETVGIEFIAHHSCSEAHHADHVESNHNLAHDTCCSTDLSAEDAVSECPVEGKCELTRFQLDTFYSLTTAIQLQVPVLELDTTEMPYVRLSDFICQAEKILYYPPPESDIQSGRSILTQKSVLVI